MKKTTNIAVYLALLFVFLAVICVKIFTTSSVQQKEYSPFNNMLPITDSDILYGANYIINSDGDFYKYENNMLKVPLEIHNVAKETTIGIMVFVNGIIQKTTLDQKNSKYLHEITLKSNSKSQVTLQFLPACQIDDTQLDLRILTMLNPSGGYDETNFSYGNKHAVMQLDGAKAISLKNVRKVSNKHQISCEYIDIKLDKYLLEKAAIAESPYAFLYEEQPLDFNPIDIKSLLTFDFMDDEENTYRTTFFVNHEPVEFNQGAKYLEFTTKPGKANSQHITFDRDLSNKDFVYSITIPMNHYNQNVIKTNSQRIANT